MSANRIAHLFDRPEEGAAAQAATAPGFESLPLNSVPEIAEQCQSSQSVYEMAYLFARMGYVVGE